MVFVTSIIIFLISNILKKLTHIVWGQDVDLATELGVRMDGARLAEDLATLDALLVNAAEQRDVYKRQL